MIKSPLFYMGNKYELIEKLHMYFPKKENMIYLIFYERKIKKGLNA